MKRIISLLLVICMLFCMTLNCFADSNNNLSRAIEQKEAERNKKIHEFKIRVKEMIEKDNSKERELIEFSENLDEL